MHTTSHHYATKTNRRPATQTPRPVWRPQISTLTRDELKKIVLEALG